MIRLTAALFDTQMLVGTVFALSAVMMGAKFYIDRNVQREDVRPESTHRQADFVSARSLSRPALCRSRFSLPVSTCWS